MALDVFCLIVNVIPSVRRLSALSLLSLASVYDDYSHSRLGYFFSQSSRMNVRVGVLYHAR